MLQWYYLVTISALLITVATLIEKRLLKSEHAMSFSAASSAIAAITALIFLPFASFNLNIYQITLIFISGLLTATGYLFSARIFKHGEISTASPISNALPLLFIVMFAFLFLGENLQPIQYFGIAILIAATYLMMAEARATVSKSYLRKYATFIVLISIVSAINAILIKYLLFSINPYTYLILGQISMSICLFAMLHLKYNGVKDIINDIKNYKKGLAAMAILTPLYKSTFYVAIALAPISVASPLRTGLYVMLTVLAGGLIFNERNLRKKVVLAAIILISAYLTLL